MRVCAICSAQILTGVNTIEKVYAALVLQRRADGGVLGNTRQRFDKPLDQLSGQGADYGSCSIS